MTPGTDDFAEHEVQQIEEPSLEVTKKTVKTKIGFKLKIPQLIELYYDRTWFRELRAKREPTGSNSGAGQRKNKADKGLRKRMD